MMNVFYLLVRPVDRCIKKICFEAYKKGRVLILFYLKFVFRILFGFFLKREVVSDTIKTAKPSKKPEEENY